MDHAALVQLAHQLLGGAITPEAFARLAAGESPGATRRLDEHALSVDLDRSRRCGFPEVVYAEGKPAETILAAFASLLERGEEAFATRVSEEQAQALSEAFPTGRYNPVARTFRASPESNAKTAAADGRGLVAVVTAGSTDLPVAEEARETLAWMGVRVVSVNDVGVAGPHRLPERLAEITPADAVVVAAGMEGALPSVVGGHVACPVVAVPTSVGYGASLGGFAALLSMLNSCASNVTVVNIDAGFKAGYIAGLIATQSNPGPL